MQGGARLKGFCQLEILYIVRLNPIDPLNACECDHQKECLTTNIPEGFDDAASSHAGML